MPIIKSAKKQLRQSKVKNSRNAKKKEMYKSAVREALETKTDESKAKAYSSVDRAAKAKIIHKNKAARLKKQVAQNVKN